MQAGTWGPWCWGEAGPEEGEEVVLAGSAEPEEGWRVAALCWAWRLVVCGDGCVNAL